MCVLQGPLAAHRNAHHEAVVCWAALTMHALGAGCCGGREWLSVQGWPGLGEASLQEWWALLWLHITASAGQGLQPGLREGEIHAGHEQDPGVLVFRREDHELGKVLGTQKSGLTQALFPLSPGQWLK